MKKILLSLSLLVACLSACAQFTSVIDTAAFHTNSYIIYYGQVTFTNFCTNAAGFVSNTNWVTTGDDPATEAATINQGFTNAWLAFVAQSNRVESINKLVTNSVVSVGLSYGTLYPSNTWNLNAVTSAMQNFSTMIIDSNAIATVAVKLSNGVVTVKQLLP